MKKKKPQRKTSRSELQWHKIFYFPKEHNCIAQTALNVNFKITPLRVIWLNNTVKGV